MSIASELAKRALVEYDAMNNDIKLVMKSIENIRKAKSQFDLGVAQTKGEMIVNQYNAHVEELGRLLREIVKS